MTLSLLAHTPIRIDARRARMQTKKLRVSPLQTPLYGSFRAKFDDKLRIDGQGDVVEERVTKNNAARNVAVVTDEIIGSLASAKVLERELRNPHGALTLRLFAFSLVNLDSDGIARTSQITRYVKTTSIHANMTVRNQLTSLAARCRKAKTVHYVVKTSFEKRHQDQTRITF